MQGSVERKVKGAFNTSSPGACLSRPSRCVVGVHSRHMSVSVWDGGVCGAGPWESPAMESAARLARSPRRAVVPAMTARVVVSPRVPLKQVSCCELQHAEHQERIQRQSVLRERSGDQHIRLDSLAVSATHMSQKGAAGEALNGRRSV
jgi:hypothetical protein